MTDTSLQAQSASGVVKEGSQCEFLHPIALWVSNTHTHTHTHTHIRPVCVVICGVYVCRGKILTPETLLQNKLDGTPGVITT